MYVTVTMDEVKLTCTSSDDSGALETRTERDTLPDLFHQIQLLFNTTLSDSSIVVLQEKMRLMQRSSYYLEIQCYDLHLSQSFDRSIWCLFDEQRLQCGMALATSQVKLLHALLGLLYQQIINGCRELEAFIINYNQGSVNSDMAASVRQILLQTHQYLNNFESRMTLNIGPLDLQNYLIPKTSTPHIPQFRASLVVKMPVIFNRFKSCSTFSGVHLYWEVAGEQCEEPHQQFEVHMKVLHPTAPHGQFTRYICQSYNIHIIGLIPGRFYQFSVKRVDVLNLVHGIWMDTIILKALNFAMQAPT